MAHKELIPRLLEPPMQPVVETTTDCVAAPLPACQTHWLQLYEVKMPKKKQMWRRCPQSFLTREGEGRSEKKLLHLSLKNKASLRLGIIGWVTRFYPSKRVELPRLVSLPLTLALHCVETSGKVCRKHTAQWLCHFEISTVCSPLPPTPTLKSPLDKRDC